jgi:coenzyme F420-dependent glucose-6-phosphate dehydrogenase
MTTLGYSLSSEEFDAPTLVAQAERAERAGFSFAGISDHFHPWVDAQGESPFVWGTLGAIAARTERLEVITGVTCPTQRIHRRSSPRRRRPWHS